jgi:hypothetical protein
MRPSLTGVKSVYQELRQRKSATIKMSKKFDGCIPMSSIGEFSPGKTGLSALADFFNFAV